MRSLRAFFRNRLAVVCAVILVVTVLASVFAPWLPLDNPNHQDLAAALQPPSAAHLLGTDQFGRDLLARIVYGARLALVMGALAVAGAVVVGTFLGLVAGYAGGWLDTVVMRTMDIFLAFPYLLIAIAIVTALGPGTGNAAVAIAIWLMPSAARVIRAAVLEIRSREYVEAAHALGARSPRVVMRHLLPNVTASLTVFSTVAIGRAIIMDSALSFLGLGAQPPTASWGNMVSSGRTYLVVAPHIALLPGVAILVTVVSFNLVGDGIKDALNPRSNR
ncbi:MAG: ABC transporter permease [Deinococcales bacterium]|jgi:peptide/nickel transport system permease protein